MARSILDASQSEGGTRMAESFHSIDPVMVGPHVQSYLSRMVSFVSLCITKKAVVSAFLKILMAAGEVKASTEIHVSVCYRSV